MNIGIHIVILTVLVFSLAGLYYSRRRKINLEEFIAARKSFSTGLLTLSIVMTGMGAWILFSPAETAIIAGVGAVIGYALSSAGSLFIFIWIGNEVRKKMPRGYTLTEYIYQRYGKAMYVIVLIATVFYMSIVLTAELTGIGLAGKMVFDLPIFFTVTIIGLGTLIYTAVGGLRVSVFTDKIQSWVVLPLLGVVFIVAFFFGGSAFIEKAANISPGLFDLGNWTGIEYGLTLFIAIIGAELFNNANWQRVYAAKTKQKMKKSFFYAGLIIIPILIMTSIYGFLAVGAGAAEVPSVAFFTYLLSNMPYWVILLTMILAIALIMSSMDSILNGLVSLGVIDIVRLKPKMGKKRILYLARWITVIVALITMLVALKEYSVLYLFLVADLVCVAAVFPTFYGLFNKRYSGRLAVISVILGLVAGALIFPNPSFSRGNLLMSFVVGFFVPVIISVIGNLFIREEFDFKTLKTKTLISVKK